MIDSMRPDAGLPTVQHGIQRVYDEASSYYRNLRWEKNRLTRFERDLTRLTLEQEIGSAAVGSVLEVGCGPGTWTGLLAEQAGRVTALDISPGMLEQARRAVSSPHVTFVNADAASFDTSERFDRVVSVRVLEYIPEWRSVVSTVARLLEPGGRIVLITKTPLSVWRGTGRERWFTTGARRAARRMLGRGTASDFWQKHIRVRDMQAVLAEAGIVHIKVRPVIFGLPIFVRGTMQYPLVPEFGEMPVLRAAAASWRWVSGRGELVRRCSLVFSESYAISGERV